VEKNPKWTAGKVKGALEFTDVKNQGVLVKHNDVLNLGTEDVSLEAWFKTAKKTGQRFMYIKRNGPGYYIKLRDGMLYDIMMGPLEAKSRAKRPLLMIKRHR